MATFEGAVELLSVSPCVASLRSYLSLPSKRPILLCPEGSHRCRFEMRSKLPIDLCLSTLHSKKRILIRLRTLRWNQQIPPCRSSLCSKKQIPPCRSILCSKKQ